MNTNEFICQNIECDYYENGYCWGHGWPVKNIKECSEWDMWTGIMYSLNPKAKVIIPVNIEKGED